MYDDIDEDYYKPIRIGNAFSSNYIDYESNGDKDKKLSIKDYFNEIRPYLNDLIDSYRTHSEWKVQLTMPIKFFSLKILKELLLRIIAAITDILISNEADEIIEKIFDYFLKRYQEGLERSIKGSEFVYGRVDLLHYIFLRKSLKRGGS